MRPIRSLRDILPRPAGRHVSSPNRVTPLYVEYVPPDIPKFDYRPMISKEFADALAYEIERQNPQVTATGAQVLAAERSCRNIQGHYLDPGPPWAVPPMIHGTPTDLTKDSS